MYYQFSAAAPPVDSSNWSMRAISRLATDSFPCVNIHLRLWGCFVHHAILGMIRAWNSEHYDNKGVYSYTYLSCMFMLCTKLKVGSLWRRIIKERVYIELIIHKSCQSLVDPGGRGMFPFCIAAHVKFPFLLYVPRPLLTVCPSLILSCATPLFETFCYAPGVKLPYYVKGAVTFYKIIANKFIGNLLS